MIVFFFCNSCVPKLILISVGLEGSINAARETNAKESSLLIEVSFPMHLIKDLIEKDMHPENVTHTSTWIIMGSNDVGDPCQFHVGS
jgi:hypothetical protein